MIERPRDKTGDRYEYFTCSRRRRKTTTCTRSTILAERIEAEIEHTYQQNSLTETEAAHVRKVLNDVFGQLENSSEDEHIFLTAQRDKPEAKRLKLVQAHYADAIPLDLLKREQDRIRTPRSKTDKPTSTSTRPTRWSTTPTPRRRPLGLHTLDQTNQSALHDTPPSSSTFALTVPDWNVPTTAASAWPTRTCATPTRRARTNLSGTFPSLKRRAGALP